MAKNIGTDRQMQKSTGSKAQETEGRHMKQSFHASTARIIE